MRSNTTTASLLAVFGIASVLTGCRFGNHVETAPNPDQISGVYEMIPARLTYKISTASQDKILDPADTNRIPGGFDGVLSNPVGLVMKNLTTGLAYFVNPVSPGNGSLSVFASTDGTLGGIGSPYTQAIWDDPNCTLQNSFEESGSYRKSGNTMQTFQNYRVIGRVALIVKVTNVIAAANGGSCTPSLQKMYDCYSDASKCVKAGSNQTATQMSDEVHGTFDTFINAGVMIPSDILTLTSMIYQIQYE